MRKIILSALALSTVAAAAPAAAAQYGDYNRGYGYQQGQRIDRQLDQIRQRIDQAARRGLVSRNEANRLFRRAEQIDRLEDRYARNGLNPREHQELQARVQDLRQELRWERQEGRRDRW